MAHLTMDDVDKRLDEIRTRVVTGQSNNPLGSLLERIRGRGRTNLPRLPKLPRTPRA